MLERISAYLSTLLLQEKIITADEKDTYKYGFEITIANMINGLIVLSVGLGLNMLAEAILFYLVFVSLRFFCGGYHADSYIKCFFSFGLTTIVCLSFSVRLAQYEELILIPFWITAVILGWHIIKMAPIEHKNRILIEDERRIFRRRSIQIYICITKISTFLILCDLAVCLATLYVSFSLVFALMRYLQGKVFLIRFYSPTTLSSSRAEFRLPSRLACA